MNDLIITNNDEQRVSARDLHERLEIGTKFTMWFERMCEYGFTEGEDFFPILGKTPNTGGRPSTDYEMTLSMAKEICMLQRNEKGKEIRKYLIEVEKAWNEPTMVLSRALTIADNKLQEMGNTVKRLVERVEEMRPKEVLADAISTSTNSIKIGELAKILCQNGIDIGQNRLFAWLRENGYLVKAKDRYGYSNLPTQRAIEMGLFEIKEGSRVDSYGQTKITLTTLVTGKGQIYFVNKFLKEEFER